MRALEADVVRHLADFGRALPASAADRCGWRLPAMGNAFDCGSPASIFFCT
jgi:hypothetical protein